MLLWFYTFCECLCECSHTCGHMGMCRGRKSALLSSPHSLPYFDTVSLLLNLEFSVSDRLAGQGMPHPTIVLPGSPCMPSVRLLLGCCGSELWTLCFHKHCIHWAVYPNPILNFIKSWLSIFLGIYLWFLNHVVTVFSIFEGDVSSLNGYTIWQLQWPCGKILISCLGLHTLFCLFFLN